MRSSGFVFWWLISLVVCLCVGAAVHAPATHLRLHLPPVDAPIIDHFRPPPKPWLPGNRGLEYDTVPGQHIRSSQAGVVTFAGPIGAERYLTVAHDAHLSTTYSFVAELRVHRGARVGRGQIIAVAAETFHFGAIFDDRYVDPALLFVSVPVRRVRLIE